MSEEQLKAFETALWEVAGIKLDSGTTTVTLTPETLRKLWNANQPAGGVDEAIAYLEKAARRSSYPWSEGMGERTEDDYRFEGMVYCAQEALKLINALRTEPIGEDHSHFLKALQNIKFALNNSRTQDEALHTIGNEVSWALTRIANVTRKE